MSIPVLNRAELVRSILVWEQAAAQATKHAATLRDQLAQAARDEYTTQGTAPTWKIPNIATVTLPVSKPTVRVSNEQALLAWALQRRPHAVETVRRIRESDLRALLADAAAGIIAEVANHLGNPADHDHL